MKFRIAYLELWDMVLIIYIEVASHILWKRNRNYRTLIAFQGIMTSDVVSFTIEKCYQCQGNHKNAILISISSQIRYKFAFENSI